MPPELVGLPKDILITLPEYLHDIEDYKNLSSTCETLRACCSVASPSTILRLAANSSRTFFRPSPHFLVAATARQLGDWARLTAENEQELAACLPNGIDALLLLSIKHCGLTVQRIRELHQMRFSVINPVTDLVDKCVGEQWYATPDFWNGGVDDAYTIDVDPPVTLFHLAIYGELFGPDFDILFNPGCGIRSLSVATRLEYIKYCVPDWACHACQDSAMDVTLPDGTMDSRRLVHATGPYVERFHNSSQIGLHHLLLSSRWNPSWAEARKDAGPDFADPDAFYTDQVDYEEVGWRQSLWQAVMWSQGLEGLKMISGELELWKPKIEEWRRKIEEMQSKPESVTVGRNSTYVYPFLKGDLEICYSGYVSGT
jgi:hypothetical protein